MQKIPPDTVSGGILRLYSGEGGLGLAGILTTSELVIAMLSAHFVLGEAVSPLAWLGIALIFGGILVGNRVPAPRKKSRADLHEACEMRYN